MSLSAGLNTALSGLSVASDQVALVSRNITRAGDANATRKYSEIESLPGGGVRTSSVLRSANAGLLAHLLEASAATGRASVTKAQLDDLGAGFLDPSSDQSPAAAIGRLADALQLAATNPADAVRLSQATSAASELVLTLNDASRTILDLVTRIDQELGTSVDRVNGLLMRLEQINNQVVGAARSRIDSADLLDTRDGIIKDIATEIGVRITPQADNGVALHTDSGIVLFDKTARTVTFAPGTLAAGISPGNPILIDGVPAIGGQKIMEVESGRMKGLVEIRDNVAPILQAQIDEVARGLVEAFAEYDQSPGGTAAPRPGLFTYPGATTVPAAGVRLPGLAGQLIVNPNADPAAGGDPRRLRDGGISDPGDPAFTYNATSAAGYSDRLHALIGELNGRRAFDASAAAGTHSTLGQFAAGAVSWFQSIRQSASREFDYHTAVAERAGQALSNATGVNLDQEMARLLEVERAFQASSRLITVVDEMIQMLLRAVA
jgi:flagellar hook-associated protein 1